LKDYHRIGHLKTSHLHVIGKDYLVTRTALFNYCLNLFFLLLTLSSIGDSLNGKIGSELASFTNLNFLILVTSPLLFVDLQDVVIDNLLILDFSDVNLISGLPDISRSLSLGFVRIYGCHVTGMLPETLPPRLMSLELGFNELTGTIPSSYGTHPFLDTLDLSYNSLSGTIPPTLFDFPLTHLHLENNKLQCADRVNVSQFLSEW